MSFYSNCAGSAADITPSDTVDLSAVSVVFVGGTGNMAVITAGGDSVTFNNVQGGSTLPARVKRVLSTGTTATNLVALS